MNITTLEATTYKGCKVYVRNFNNIFEYLAIVDEQLYTSHIVVTKSPIQTIFGKPYTKQQLEDTTKYLMNMAQATIDYIKGDNKVKKQT